MNVTVTKIPPRPNSGGEFMRICQAPGCFNSASWHIELFPGYRDHVCGDCKIEWLNAYGAAICNWTPVALDTDAESDGGQQCRVAA